MRQSSSICISFISRPRLSNLFPAQVVSALLQLRSLIVRLDSLWYPSQLLETMEVKSFSKTHLCSKVKRLLYTLNLFCLSGFSLAVTGL